REWWPESAEALAGERFNRKGLLEPVLPGELWALQERLKRSADIAANPGGSGLTKQGPRAADFYERWARWFVAESSQRTVQPSSSKTIAQHAQSLAEERVSYAAAKEALFLRPTNVTAMSA